LLSICTTSTGVPLWQVTVTTVRSGERLAEVPRDIGAAGLVRDRAERTERLVRSAFRATDAGDDGFQRIASPLHRGRNTLPAVPDGQVGQFTDALCGLGGLRARIGDVDLRLFDLGNELRGCGQCAALRGSGAAQY
jgi:hypothetical protein